MSAIVIPFPARSLAESVGQRIARLRLSEGEACLALVICAVQMPDLVGRELDAIEAARAELGVPLPPQL